MPYFIKFTWDLLCDLERKEKEEWRGSGGLRETQKHGCETMQFEAPPQETNTKY